MSTIFSKIIKGEIPSYKIAENDDYFAFLDINPLRAGHTLVVPKRETDYIFDLEDVYLSGIISATCCENVSNMILVFISEINSRRLLTIEVMKDFLVTGSIRIEI